MGETVPERFMPEVRLRGFFVADGTEISSRAAFEKFARDLFKVPGNEEVVEKVCVDHLAQLTDVRDRGVCLRTLGFVFINEDPNQAIEYFRRAERAYVEAGDTLDRVATMFVMAKAYSMADRLPEALHVTDRQAKIFAGHEMELGPSVGLGIEQLEQELLETACQRRMYGLVQHHIHRALSGEIYKDRAVEMHVWSWRINPPN